MPIKLKHKDEAGTGHHPSQIEVVCLFFSKTGANLLAGGYDQRLALWDTKSA